MKKTLIAATLAAFFLAGCTKPETTEAETPPLKTAKASASSDKKAELGSFGVDLSARNEAVKPGDDFFMYASGTWYDNYKMPADKTRYGAFSGLAERSEERVKEIIEKIAARNDLNTEEQLIANFYNAYMDTQTLNKLGLAPIKPLLNDISAVSSTDDLTMLFGQAWLSGVNSPIGGGMWFNRLDPNKYEMSLGAGGLGLPDRSYYLEDSERFAKTRAAYVAHIAQMLTLADVEN
ncbi:MAG: M13 family peptidase, partial [Pseudoalteromonas sp.]